MRCTAERIDGAGVFARLSWSSFRRGFRLRESDLGCLQTKGSMSCLRMELNSSKLCRA